MAKNVVPVKSQTPLVDEPTKASIDVIRSAEIFAAALGHGQRAADLSKQIDNIGKLLDRARIDLRDWKYHTAGHVEALGGELATSVGTWYEEIRQALEFDFLAVGDVLKDRIDAAKDDGRVPY